MEVNVHTPLACVCVSMHAHARVCVHVHMCVHMHGGVKKRESERSNEKGEKTDLC